MNQFVGVVDCEGLVNVRQLSSEESDEDEEESTSYSLEDGVVLKDNTKRNADISSSLSCSCEEVLEGEGIRSSSSSSSSGFLEESSAFNPRGECETEECLLFPRFPGQEQPTIMDKKGKVVEVSVISLGPDLIKGEGMVKGQMGGINKKKPIRKGFCGRYLGIILALGSSVIFPLGGLAVKALGENYHTYSISVWRFQGVLLPAIPIALYHRCIKGDMIFDTVLPLGEPGKIKMLCFLVVS